MSLAVVYSRAQRGTDAPLVTVEVHLANGLPGMSLVGLPEAAVRESRDRVKSALSNSRFNFPNRRITVNLAPADLPKQGGRYDLPIAMGILIASGQLDPTTLSQYEWFGELALGGELRPITGLLPSALACAKAGRTLVLPRANAAEAALVGEELTILAADHLLEVVAHLTGEQPIPPFSPVAATTTLLPMADLADVHGQQQAKRALEIAASGGHNLLFIGPPGTGKTMLASRLPGILPPLSKAQALESAAIASVSAQGIDLATWRQRPFIAPHHSASEAAVIGGGQQPKPGAISLANHGVLFLDEMPEFNRRVLEALREPLESAHVTIARANYQVSYPAQVQLVAAMNPCPCGYLGDRQRPCRCTPEQVRRYRSRVSGPLLDRIDLHIEVPRLPPEALHHDQRGEPSAEVRERVGAAQQRQLERAGFVNAQMTTADIDQLCPLGKPEYNLLQTAMQRLNLSPRAYHRLIKIARTIADLDQHDTISRHHLAEAINYRSLDRQPT